MQRRTLILDDAPWPMPRPSLLNDQERAIVGLLAKGLSNHEIGASVAASRATIDRTIRASVRKLDARNRVEAVAKAVRTGLI